MDRSLGGGGTQALGPGRRGGGLQMRARIEIITGTVVLLAVAAALGLALTGSGRKGAQGYRLSASFDHVDGLDVGADVRLAGVPVGQVLSETIDPKTFRAQVSFTVRDDVKLPDDSSAVITSDGLMGGKYIALDPGGSDSDIHAGGQVTMTQGAISLEQLLTKFIFSVTGKQGQSGAQGQSGEQGSAQPETAPGTSPGAPAGSPARAPVP